MKGNFKTLVASLGACVFVMGYADTNIATSGVSTINQEAVITTYKTVISGPLNANSLLFSGKAQACSKPSATPGTDCCDNPIAIGCTAKEMELNQSIRQDRAIYVGESCIKNKSGKCTLPLAVYCVFPDAISSLAQKEGRAQLNLTFGTPDAPQCNGLTKDQIQQIDFTKIDFNAIGHSPTDQASIISSKAVANFKLSNS